MAEIRCGKQGCYELADRKNGKYCSRAHAPYGGMFDGPTPYVQRTRKSTIKAPGEVSVPSFSSAPEVERKEIPKREKKKQTSRVAPIIKKILSYHVKRKENSGTLSQMNKNSNEAGNRTLEQKWPHGTPPREGVTPKTENNICAKNTQEEKNETPSTDCSQPLIVLEKVRSESMILIDESAKQLRELMKSAKHDPKGIQSACQCASEIHKLMRLKFDIARTNAP